MELVERVEEVGGMENVEVGFEGGRGGREMEGDERERVYELMEGVNRF